MNLSPLARGRILCLLCAALWSTSGAFVKNLETPALTVAMYRAIFAGGALLFYLFASNHGLGSLTKRRITWDRRMVGMLASFAAMNYMFISSMSQTTAANTIFLQYTAPFWMFLASVTLLGEPIQKIGVVSLLGALLGIGLLLAGNWESESGHQAGILLGLGSGFAYAGVAVFLRMLREHDAVWLATLNLVGTGLILLVAAILWSFVAPKGSPTLYAPPSREKLLWISLFGISQMAIPYVLFGMGLKEVGPQEAGILTLVEPVLTPTWTYLTVGEQPSTATLVGGSIVISMVLLRYLPIGKVNEAG